jgi:threonine 3-dehydrogenase
MKAVVKARAEPGLWLEEVPVPEVRGDDVRIRVLKTSICGTDVHIYNWDAWAQKTIPVPMTIGHEFVGVVDDVGDHVKGFVKGDLVVGEGHITCGHCRNCLAGRRHLCPNTGCGRESPRRVGGIRGDSQDNCWHADPRSRSMCFPVSIRWATPCTCALVRFGRRRCAITGAGPIGCMAIPICKRAGRVTSQSPTSIHIASISRAKWAIELDVRGEKVTEAMQAGREGSMSRSKCPAI